MWLAQEWNPKRLSPPLEASISKTGSGAFTLLWDFLAKAYLGFLYFNIHGHKEFSRA